MARKQKNEASKFAVTVLWLHGMSISQIAGLLEMTGGQVRGIVDRAKAANRSEMDEYDRQLALNELALDRKDGGLIPDRYFRVKELRPEQVREIRPANAVIRGGWRKTERHPKGAVYLPSLFKPIYSNPYQRDEDFERRRREFYANCAYHFEFENWRIYFHRYEKLDRDEKGETVGGRDGRPAKKLRYGPREKIMERDINAGALEWLDGRNLLDDVQITAGYRARADMEGAQVSTLKSADLEASGGGFGTRLVADYTIDCMRYVERLKASMPPSRFRVLEELLLQDRWLWDGMKGKERRAVYDRIRLSLDYAAMFYGLLWPVEFEQRHKDEFPWHDKRARDGKKELYRAMSRANSTPFEPVAWGEDRAPTAEELIDMTMKLPEKVRRVSRFVCSYDFMCLLKMARDANGNYLVMPSGFGAEFKLIGYPIQEKHDARGLTFGPNNPSGESR